MRIRAAFVMTMVLSASVVTRSQNVVAVVTYDFMGRRTSTTTTGIATVGSVTTTTAYDLPSRTIITTHPGGAVTTTELDVLGRTKRRVTQTGSSPIEQQFAYDLAGNQVFATDMRTASATAFDAHGRAVATRAANGTIATTDFDEWDRPKSTRVLADDGASAVAESSYDLTAAGRVKSMTTKVDAELAGAFLEALLEAARSLCRAAYDIPLAANQNELCAAARRSAKLAGGAAYASFFNALIGCDQ